MPHQNMEVQRRNVSENAQEQRNRVGLNMNEWEEVDAPLRQVQAAPIQQQAPLSPEQQTRRQRLEMLRAVIIDTKMKYFPEKTALTEEYKTKFSIRYSDDKRSAARRKPSSRLYKKRERAEMLQKAQEEEEKSCLERLTAQLGENQIPTDAEEFYDLSVFMTQNASLNERIVGQFLGQGGEQAGQDKVKALDQMVSLLLESDLSGMRLDNDVEIARNAGKLEQLTRRIAAFDRLAEKNGYFNTLDGEAAKEINAKLERVRSIAYYYTLRKEVITDTYYITHYNEELSMDEATGTTDEQKAIAKKLLASFVAGRHMMQVNGAGADFIHKRGKPAIKDEQRAKQLVSAEENSLTETGIKRLLREKYLQSASAEKRDEARAKTAFAQKALQKKAVENLKEFKGSLELRTEQKPYSEEQAGQYLKELEKISVREMKFASYTQMIENYSYNYALCERVRLLHGEIMRALMHGMKIPEAQLLDIRTKTKCFYEMSVTLRVVNKELVLNENSFRNSKEDWDEVVKQEAKKRSIKGKGMPVEAGYPGDPQELYARCMETVWEEDSTKNDSIRTAWSALVSESKDAQIPPEELERRRREYNRNAVVNDYMYQYTEDGDLGYDPASIYDNYLEQQEEKNGIQKSIRYTRSFATMIRGQSAAEVERLRKLATGTPEEQMSYYKELIKTAKSIPLKEYNAQDMGALFDHFAKKHRAALLSMDGVNNAAVEIPKLIKEEEKRRSDARARGEEPGEMKLTIPQEYADMEDMLRDLNVYFGIGCSFTAPRTVGFVQIPSSRFMHALSYQELGYYDRSKLLAIIAKLDKFLDDCDDNTASNLNLIFKKIDGFISPENYNFPLSGKEIQANEVTEHLTFDVDIEQQYQQDLADYEIHQQRKARMEQAQKYNANFEKVYHKNDRVFQADESAEANASKLNTAGKRSANAIANCMEEIMKQSGVQDYKVRETNINLLYNAQSASPEELEKMAAEFERIMTFVEEKVDVTQFNFEDPDTLLSEDKMYLRVLAALGYESDWFFGRYQEVREKAAASGLNVCAFSEEKVAKIRNKFKKLQIADAWYKVYPEIAENSLSYGYDIKELLNKPLEELAILQSDPEMAHKLGRRWATFIGKILHVKYAMEESPNQPAFGPGIALKEEAAS